MLELRWQRRLITVSMPSGVEHFEFDGGPTPSRPSDHRLDAFGR